MIKINDLFDQTQGEIFSSKFDLRSSYQFKSSRRICLENGFWNMAWVLWVFGDVFRV